MAINLPPDWTIESLATGLAVHPETVRRALSGRAKPAMVPYLHHLTHGELPAWKLRPDLWAEGSIPPNPFKDDGTPPGEIAA